MVRIQKWSVTMSASKKIKSKRKAKRAGSKALRAVGRAPNCYPRKDGVVAYDAVEEVV